MRQFKEAWKDPSLELWRALLPFWVFWALLTGIVLLPIPIFIFFIAFLRFNQPFDWQMALLLPMLGSLCCAILLGIPEAFGRLSGYRPFVAKWTIDSTEEADRQTVAIRRVARHLKFETMWETLLGGFVAVEGRQRAMRVSLTHSAKEAPTRLFFDLARTSSGTFSARLEVQVTTCVMWDTGERMRLESVGRKLLKAAGVSIQV